MLKDEADRMTRANWAARRWIDQASAHILPYRGKRPLAVTAALIQERGSRIIEGLLEVVDVCAYTVRMSARACVQEILEICVDLIDQGPRNSTSGPPQAETTPPSLSADRANATALLFSRNWIQYLFGRIADDQLVNLQPGGESVPPEKLRLLFDTQLPAVRSVIAECIDRTARYAALPGADLKVINDVQAQCQVAETWCEELVNNYRSAQLHLDRNATTREVTFKRFDPKGSVSIYEFLSLFEEWCYGHVSDTEKTRLLFSKYLHTSLTQGYEELKKRKHSYSEMKAWLIDNFGSVKSVADGQIRAIKALKVPRPTDNATAHVTYIREIHRLLSTLYNLKVSHGVRVPQLRNHKSHFPLANCRAFAD
jgi:hypothetical protein